METITYYEIECSVYHGQPVMRLRCVINGSQLEESGLYSPAEITNILYLWRDGALCGSFAIGTKLADNATFIMYEKE